MQNVWQPCATEQKIILETESVSRLPESHSSLLLSTSKLSTTYSNWRAARTQLPRYPNFARVAAQIRLPRYILRTLQVKRRLAARRSLWIRQLSHPRARCSR